MRLFAGIPIVDDARREIIALLGRLREGVWPVRCVHDEGLHLTLKFFGEVAPERLDVIEEAVRFAGQGHLFCSKASKGVSGWLATPSWVEIPMPC